MAGENTAVRFLQQGSVLEVASGGTISVLAGGSIQNAGGQSVASLSATNASFAGTISIGGTAGRWAFGSATLTNGSALVFTGLSQVVSAHVHPLGAAPGTAAGTASSFQIEASRFANGTIYALGLAGTFNFAGAGTVVWTAFGY